MKPALILTTLLSLFVSLNVNATNHILVMGGGGEPQGDSTIMDTALNSFGNFYANNKWGKSDVSFNGGHGNTEDIISKKFNTTNTPFTNDSYNQEIESYKNALKNGQIKNGDQLMIYIDSHGAIKDGTETSHSIATSGSSVQNYNTLSGSSTVSLDKLKDLSKLAKDKGVKLAIIDLSCHSGNTINLGDSNTCVISSTGPNHYGFGGGGDTFANKFAARLQKGKNLEDIFLDARKETGDSSFPMISTPQNQLISRFEYESIGPFLYYYDDSTDKLSPYLLNNLSQANGCKREDGFKKLNDMINKVEELNTVKKKILLKDKLVKEVDLTNLRFNLKQYKDIQDSLIQKLKELKADKLQTIEKLSSDRSKGTFISTEYTWSEMLATDFDKWINEAQDNVSKGKDVSYNQMKISMYSNGKKRRDEILRANPGIESAAQTIKNFDKNVKSTYQLANAIARDEKALYNALYKGQADKFKGTDNACKNFVL